MAEPGTVARHVVVHGRVQGVFFRDTCRRKAESVRVAGWVRNRSDGTVEILVEGESAAVADLVAWAGQGPPRAQVDGIEVGERSPTGLRGFVAH